MFCSCVFLRSRITFCCEKYKKETPKETQKETKSHSTRGCLTSQNIWYLLHGSHILQFRMCSGIAFFLHRFSNTVFLSTFSTFEKLGTRMVPKMDEYSGGEMCQNSTRRQKAPMRAQGEPRTFQMTPKSSPRVPK